MTLPEFSAQSAGVSPFPPIAGWGITMIPSGWIYVPDFGIKQLMIGPAALAANVSLGQDQLSRAAFHHAGPAALADYIAGQTKLITNHLTGAQTAGPRAIAFPAAEEAHLLFVRHRPVGSPDMLHVQTYVRSGLWIGIVTLTTPEAQLPVVRPGYDAFVKGLRVPPPTAG